MASYYVLTPPVLTNTEKDTLFIRDGFSWPAFLFPFPWLLVRKLWLIAALAVLFYLASVFVAEYWGLDGLPVAFSFILSLWAGLEGGHVRAHALEKKGWTIQAAIQAHDLDEAEELYFSGTAQPKPQALAISGSQQPIATGTRAPGPVALGLIGPYGSR